MTAQSVLASEFSGANEALSETGSAWVEYQKTGTMHDIKLPEGLKESTRFEPALFTPSTKAEVGDKDENIHPDKGTLVDLSIVLLRSSC